MIDTALMEREATRKPIRVGIVGAGATGRAIALQLGTPVPGMRLVAIANRTAAHGERAFREAGISEWTRVDIGRRGRTRRSRAASPVLTEDPSVLTACDAIDVIVEVDRDDRGRGSNGAATRIEHGKDVVLVNAELDSLLGPILKVEGRSGRRRAHAHRRRRARRRHDAAALLRSLGLRPVAAGNIKGMVDYYRNPETQRAFAEKTRSGRQKGHLVRRRDEAVDGDDGARQRDRLSVRPPRHVRTGVRARHGDGAAAAGRTDARHRPGRLCGRRGAAHRRVRRRPRRRRR